MSAQSDKVSPQPPALGAESLGRLEKDIEEVADALAPAVVLARETFDLSGELFEKLEKLGPLLRSAREAAAKNQKEQELREQSLQAPLPALVQKRRGFEQEPDSPSRLPNGSDFGRREIANAWYLFLGILIGTLLVLGGMTAYDLIRDSGEDSGWDSGEDNGQSQELEPQEVTAVATSSAPSWPPAKPSVSEYLDVERFLESMKSRKARVADIDGFLDDVVFFALHSTSLSVGASSRNRYRELLRQENKEALERISGHIKRNRSDYPQFRQSVPYENNAPWRETIQGEGDSGFRISPRSSK